MHFVVVQCRDMSQHLPVTNKLKCHVVSRHLPEIFTPPAPHTYRSKAYIREITLPHSDPGLSVICLCVITAAPAAYHSHSQTPVQVDLLTRFPPPDGGVETSLGFSSERYRSDLVFCREKEGSRSVRLGLEATHARRNTTTDGLCCSK